MICGGTRATGLHRTLAQSEPPPIHLEVNQWHLHQLSEVGTCSEIVILVLLSILRQPRVSVIPCHLKQLRTRLHQH